MPDTCGGMTPEQQRRLREFLTNDSLQTMEKGIPFFADYLAEWYATVAREITP